MKLVVGLSWGPDSMLLTYFLAKSFWKENLILAHFNHKFRKESDLEEEKLKKIFSNRNLQIGHYKWSNFSEKNLRIARYNFFKTVGWWKYYLVLGHNLTDRIETSFLNLIRWWGLDWFLNMRQIDHNKKILRPLLNLSKLEILEKCEALAIPYFVDKTNFDTRISVRNLIRKKIISFLENYSFNLYYSFKKLYSQLEELYPYFNIPAYLEKIEKSLYLLHFPSKHLRFFVKQLLDYFNVRDLRQGVITELINYIQNAKWWGFKQYGCLKFYKKKWKIYLEIWQNCKKNI